MNYKQLHLSFTFILLINLAIFCNTAQAIQVQYQLTSQNSVTNYAFSLFNNGNAANVQAFTVDFNPTNFNEATLATTATPTGWIATKFPSGPGFPATLDFYSTNPTPISANQTVTGFAARVAQLGNATPGAVPYVVYATTFAALGQGAAAPVGGGVAPVAPITVPTLHTWALLLLIGLMWFVTRPKIVVFSKRL